jgi:type I restriction enzyme R subunit
MLLEFRNGIESGHKQAAVDLGLNETEFAFYNILMAEVTAHNGEETVSEAVHDEIKTTSQELVGMFDEATQIVDFFNKLDEVKRMKKEIKRAILDTSFGEKSMVTVVQDRFLELAKTKFA